MQSPRDPTIIILQLIKRAHWPFMCSTPLVLSTDRPISHMGRRCRSPSSADGFSGHANLTSVSSPARIFITQSARGWLWMDEPSPSPQHSTIRLNLPLPASTRFRVYRNLSNLAYLSHSAGSLRYDSIRYCTYSTFTRSSANTLCSSPIRSDSRNLRSPRITGRYASDGKSRSRQ